MGCSGGSGLVSILEVKSGVVGCVLPYQHVVLYLKDIC